MYTPKSFCRVLGRVKRDDWPLSECLMSVKKGIQWGVALDITKDFLEIPQDFVSDQHVTTRHVCTIPF